MTKTNIKIASIILLICLMICSIVYVVYEYKYENAKKFATSISKNHNTQIDEIIIHYQPIGTPFNYCGNDRIYEVVMKNGDICWIRNTYLLYKYDVIYNKK